MFRIDSPFAIHANASSLLTLPLGPQPWPSPFPPTGTLEKAWIGMDWANKGNIGPFGTILFLFYIIIHQLEPFKRVLGYEIKF